MSATHFLQQFGGEDFFCHRIGKGENNFFPPIYLWIFCLDKHFDNCFGMMTTLLGAGIMKEINNLRVWLCDDCRRSDSVKNLRCGKWGMICLAFQSLINCIYYAMWHCGRIIRKHHSLFYRVNIYIYTHTLEKKVVRHTVHAVEGIF